jgi:hypothetical protein
VELGQGIKDRAALVIKEAADLLTGTRLLEAKQALPCCG